MAKRSLVKVPQDKLHSVLFLFFTLRHDAADIYFTLILKSPDACRHFLKKRKERKKFYSMHDMPQKMKSPQ